MSAALPSSVAGPPLAGLAGQSQARADQRAEAAVQAFTRIGAAPRPTFPLVLASVSVAVLAMHADLVAKYSLGAFWIGVVATAGLAIGVGRIVSRIPSARPRMAAALVLPTVGGALVGVLVQAIVLLSLRDLGGAIAIKDLGGLVDSTDPVSWLAAGLLLGALPALAVSVFLMLCARALEGRVGSDAAEGFNVAFTGGAGVLAAVGLVLVEPWELPPLLVVCVLASVSMLVSFLVDGARLRFLSEVWAGATGGGENHVRSAYEVVPADRFMHDPSLAPIVTKAGAVSVLVRVDRRVGSYRASAAEPIALLADTEAATTRPLRRRRAATVAVVVAMMMSGGLSILTQPALTAALGADSLTGRASSSANGRLFID